MQPMPLLSTLHCAPSMAQMAYFTKCVIYHPKAPSPRSVLRILDSGTARECGVLRPQERHPLPSHPANHSPLRWCVPSLRPKIRPSSQNWPCHMDSPRSCYLQKQPLLTPVGYPSAQPRYSRGTLSCTRGKLRLEYGWLIITSWSVSSSKQVPGCALPGKQGGSDTS